MPTTNNPHWPPFQIVMKTTEESILIHISWQLYHSSMSFQFENKISMSMTCVEW